MRLFKYLSKHKGAVALVFVLLICQAFCDLMLPSYTARIVDVGIQQSGIEHVSPDALTPQTHDAITAQLTGDDLASFQAAYELTGRGEAYHLTSQGQQDRAQLDSIMALPLAAVHGLAQPGMDENLLEQVGIAAARAEYESLGYDVASMQMTYLIVTALKMMGFVLLSVAIASAVGFVAARTGAKIGRSLRSKLFAKVMSFSDAEVQRFSAASLITRGTNDIQQIQMMSIMLLRMVLYAPILGVGGVIMIARTDMSMGWIIGVAVCAIVAVVLTLMMISMPKFRIMQKLVDKVNLVAREMLTGVSVVRAFGQQEREQKRFDDASMQLMRTQLFTNRVMTFMMPSMIMIMNVVSVVIVWNGAAQIDAGDMQTGDLIAFITYSMVIIMGFLMLSILAIIAPRADVSAQRIDEVLETESSIADAPDGKGDQLLKERAALSPGAEIAFDHVSFRYDEDSECVLSDVTFTAEAGKTCAIIGSTGCGKSTIVKLVERFYDVSEGAVLIDGIDVRDLSLATLRGQLGYVPQKSFLFEGTIASNVGYGEWEGEESGNEPGSAETARVENALDIAQATDFVAGSDDGLDTYITQGGTNVSGGQRQRLAIARALATDARAFLFDDCFSALDYRTDAALRSALADRLPGKTQVIIAQRIATVMHADKILVLDDGRIVGEGTHAQLLRACPQYREIAYSQLSPEELESALGNDDASVEGSPLYSESAGQGEATPEGGEQR